MVGVVDGDVSRARSCGGDLTGFVESAGFGVDGESGGGGGWVIDSVDRIEKAFGGTGGRYGEVGGSGCGRCEHGHR